MEYQLFEHLFPGGDPGGGALAPLIDTLATMLYDTLRPAYIQLQDLGALCQLVDILHHEVKLCAPLQQRINQGERLCAQTLAGAVCGSAQRRGRRWLWPHVLFEMADQQVMKVLGEQLDRRGEAVAPLRPVLQRTLADVQHRLTFRAQAFIKVSLVPSLDLSLATHLAARHTVFS